MLIDAIFLIVLAICFITDVREQKIYNKIIIPSILIILIMNGWFFGVEGLKVSMFGLIVGFCILLIPYSLGGMGAGDVKFLAFIGASKGVLFVINSAIYMALVGGVMSLAILIFNKQASIFFKSIFTLVVSFFYGVKQNVEFSNPETSKKFPYGIAIVAGALICQFFKGAWML